MGISSIHHLEMDGFVHRMWKIRATFVRAMAAMGDVFANFPLGRLGKKRSEKWGLEITGEMGGFHSTG